MKEFKTDVLIVGGGLTGLLSAYVLSSLDLKIALIDGGKIISNNFTNKDFRTTAIAEGSKIFLENMEIWKKIQGHSERIKHINVLDRNLTSKIEFTNSKKAGNLGYVISNNLIKKELVGLLKVKKNIKIFQRSYLKNIFVSNDWVDAYLENFKIHAKLLISADGKKSFVRSIMKTPQYTKKYKHNAIVMNFSHKKNHNNIAHEIFLKTGPLALLPMKSENTNLYNTSLIWSHSKDFAYNLNATNPSLQKKIVEEKVRFFTGDIVNLFDTKIFFLTAHINIKFFEKRLVYVGDSAHSLHPIAGQGWNLGIRDVQNIYNSLKNAKVIGLDIGSEYVCKEYHSLSYYDAYSLYQITDKLNSIFLDEKNISKLIRKFGFTVINKNNIIKEKITNYAMRI